MNEFLHRNKQTRGTVLSTSNAESSNLSEKTTSFMLRKERRHQNVYKKVMCGTL